MPNTLKNIQDSDLLPIVDASDYIKISDIYYGLEDALEIVKEFPELEKGVLAILKEDYDIT